MSFLETLQHSPGTCTHGGSFDLLLGRRTYDIWSGFWPKAPSSPMADGLNAATKYIATHRPESLEWGPFEGLGPLQRWPPPIQRCVAGTARGIPASSKAVDRAPGSPASRTGWEPRLRLASELRAEVPHESGQAVHCRRPGRLESPMTIQRNQLTAILPTEEESP